MVAEDEVDRDSGVKVSLQAVLYHVHIVNDGSGRSGVAREQGKDSDTHLSKSLLNPIRWDPIAHLWTLTALDIFRLSHICGHVSQMHTYVRWDNCSTCIYPVEQGWYFFSVPRIPAAFELASFSNFFK